MKSIYEEAGGTYTRQGDYEYPDLKVPPEKEIEIGIWGQRYRRYLKQCHRIRYYNLLTAGTLNGHLAEVDQQAERMFQLLVSVLSEQTNVGYIKVDGVSSVFCFIWGWEEPAWGLPFQFHGVFYVMISMKGP